MAGITNITCPQIHDSIRSQDEFIELANSLGRPIQLPDGSQIKRLRVISSREARPNTLSWKFGESGFPFHTDTAFWPRPARLVLLRGVGGDLRRPTVIIPFMSAIPLALASKVRQTAWLCGTGPHTFYTTMQFEHDGSAGFRYDPNCMVPANKAAREIDEHLRPECSELKGELIEWRPNRVAIIPNWSYLHGRGTTDHVDFDRILERIYIY